MDLDGWNWGLSTVTGLLAGWIARLHHVHGRHIEMLHARVNDRVRTHDHDIDIDRLRNDMRDGFARVESALARIEDKMGR